MGGTKGGIEQVSALTPEQQSLFTKLMADFDPTELTDMFKSSVADPARQQFQQKTLPGIQERFIAGGGAGSGALNRAAVGAGADLESGLSGQLAQLLAQAQQGTLSRQAGLAVSPTQETFQQLSDNPMLKFLTPLLTGAGTAIGGPLGTAGGAALGNMLTGKNQQTPATKV